MKETDNNTSALIVDDEEMALVSFELSLASHGIHPVVTCSDSRQVLTILDEQPIGVLLLDLSMPHISGEELLPQIIETHPEIPVIIVTGFNEVNKAVECMKLGAFDYMVKPVEGARLATGAKRALEIRALRRENAALKDHVLDTHLHHPEAFKHIITKHPDMYALFNYCEAIAESPECVLVTGETGSGKELIVQAIHALSGRKGRFVAVNVAGLDDTVFSDTLFGHHPGAFTGATSMRSGLIEHAYGGTLFLDEIGDLNTASQVKLLRLLQENEFYPLGSDTPKNNTARVIVATQTSVTALKQSSTFRKDLFYRLQTHHVHIPPLRQRLEYDLRPLLYHFTKKACDELKKPMPSISESSIKELSHYDFPGNIRELEALVYDAVSRQTKGSLIINCTDTQESVKRSPLQSPGIERRVASARVTFPHPLPTLKEITQELVNEALRQTNHNQAAAARLLGITPQALNQRIKRNLHT